MHSITRMRHSMLPQVATRVVHAHMHTHAHMYSWLRGMQHSMLPQVVAFKCIQPHVCDYISVLGMAHWHSHIPRLGKKAALALTMAADDGAGACALDDFQVM